MNTSGEPWYFEERGQQMARLLLTRDKGVSIGESPPGQLLDLLGWVDEPAHLFGVEIKAVLHAAEAISPEDGRLRFKPELLERVSGYPFPILVAVVGMSDESIYLGWLVEPAASGELRVQPSPLVRKAGDQVMTDVLGAVRSWYAGRALQAA